MLQESFKHLSKQRRLDEIELSGLEDILHTRPNKKKSARPYLEVVTLRDLKPKPANLDEILTGLQSSEGIFLTISVKHCHEKHVYYGVPFVSKLQFFFLKKIRAFIQVQVVQHRLFINN